MIQSRDEGYYPSFVMKVKTFLSDIELAFSAFCVDLSEWGAPTTPGS